MEKIGLIFHLISWAPIFVFVFILIKTNGKDPENKFKARDMWLHNFTKRQAISKKRKTNEKSQSVEERLPKVKNLHWYTIYKMATEYP